MIWTKANNLEILQKNGYKVPGFIIVDDGVIDFESLQMQKPFILRSSYSLEDSRDNAFAWIFESYFPIFNRKDYKKGLAICKNAVKEDKFLTYININQIDVGRMKECFILQEFIIGDFSWVCFTQNKDNEMYIEITPGINKNLVEGSVKVPFQISIHRDTNLSYSVKNFFMDQYYLTLKGRKQEYKLFKDRMFEENILISHLDTLVEKFISIESLFDYPQDIEFTVANWEVYILQSRDITIL